MDGWIEVGSQREHGSQSFEGFGAELRRLQWDYCFGPPGPLTKLAKMPIRQQSGTHHSQTCHRPTVNCCLKQHRILFSLFNTKNRKLIVYNTQKTQDGPLLRVAHFLARHSNGSFYAQWSEPVPESVAGRARYRTRCGQRLDGGDIL